MDNLVEGHPFDLPTELNVSLASHAIYSLIPRMILLVSYCLIALQIDYITGYQTSYYLGYDRTKKLSSKPLSRDAISDPMASTSSNLMPNNYDVTYLVSGRNVNNPNDRMQHENRATNGDQPSWDQSQNQNPNEPQPLENYRPFRQEHEPQLIDIDSHVVPLVLNFQTRSSKIVTLQNHIPNEVEDVKETESIEKPHKLVHWVLKPIIQEVKEIISPIRKIVQEIQPVQETVHLLIATKEEQKSEPKPLSASGLLGGAGSVSYRPVYNKRSSNVKRS